MAGYSSSNDGDVVGQHGMTDGWLIKMDTAGNILWQKTMGGTWTDAITSIRHTTDGGYITAGYTLSDDGDLAGLNFDGFMGYADYWVAKLDGNATIEWQTVIGGSKNDKARGLLQTPDGGYVIAGTTESDNGDITESFGEWDWWIVKLDASGTLEWEQSLGGSERDEVRHIEACSDGSGFFIVGTTQSSDGHVTTNHGEKDMWYVKMDYSGSIITNQCFGGTGNDVGFFAIESTDRGIILTGRTNTNDNGDVIGDTQGEDLWVFKLGRNKTGIEETNNILFSIYPNPADEYLYFS